MSPPAPVARLRYANLADEFAGPIRHHARHDSRHRTLFGCRSAADSLLARALGDLVGGGELAKQCCKIGIAWDTNPNHKEHRFRSIPLKYYESLAAVDGVRLINLQKGPGTSQLASWQGRVPIIDLGERLDADGAFLDTAALMMNLDLVISVDTAVTHLAGALGVRTWLAMQYASDWRWLLDRTDCPWYPTLRLFRNRLKGDWSEVFELMAAELTARKANYLGHA